VFRSLLAERAPQLSIEIDSAGTHDYHVGEPPDERAIAAARRRGIDLSTLRARTGRVSDFDYYDLVLAMEQENLPELRQRAPAQRRERIRLLMEFVPTAQPSAVPDPYYGGPQGFEQVLDLLEEAAEGLLEEMLRRAEARPTQRSL